MDLDPRRHEQNMARWALAGSLGMVAGPVALTVFAALGAGWRGAFSSFALLCAVLLGVTWRMPVGGGVGGDAAPDEPAAGGPAAGEPSDTSAVRTIVRSAREAVAALRRGAVVRWLTLLQLSDLMLDVFHGFLALYFVDVAGAGGGRAALAVLVWTGVGLAGDALVIPLLERVDGRRYVRASAAVMLLVLPGFLLAGDGALKLALLGLLGLLSSGWYPVLKGRLYSALPGRSGAALALANVFGLAGGLLPLALGLVAERFGLAAAMWLLLAGPLALLVGAGGGRGTPP
jgi:FSR family fosmidomycin resistance protein-like MFS transporter